ncbi:MAG: rhamnulokinase [Clostridia bacterium]|nr:rhamnulokinase [Clostridia bacterium]
MKYYLAIDIGASSGRHILGHMEDGKMLLEEIHRFDNKQVRKNGHDCWDMDNLWQGILAGLAACGKKGIVPETVGIDTWGVDYLLLDENDHPVCDPVAYRDARTVGIDKEVEKRIPFADLYAKTGIQKQQFNTIYQLVAHKKERPADFEKATTLLTMPDYLHFLLTGVKKNEYTIASTTALLDASAKTWDRDLLKTLGIPAHLFDTPVLPGTVLGRLRPEIREQVGFDTTVILPASHDTGSAFLAVPALDDNAVYLSSGTWSLLGVENDVPITTPESCAQNFSNEGGAWYRFRYLKNIMGLWMIQSIRRELNGISYVTGKENRTVADRQWSFNDLVDAAKGAADFPSVVDVNDAAFLAPDSMIEAVKDYCRKTAQQVPETTGELMQCVYRSLALCYRDAIAALSKLTGKTYTSVNIVGGGCKDEYLNELTAAITGLPVLAGPVEGTAIGNLLVQMIAGGDLADLPAARTAIRNSFEIKEIRK